MDSGIVFSPLSTFFTSDSHFFHRNIITYCHRPFESIEQMNDALITNWNSVVPKNVVVFHLGDFCFGDAKQWNELLDRLHGRIYLCLGNHDIRHLNRPFMQRFAGVSHEMYIRVDRQPIILNHYPFLSFGGKEDWGWQLFGHIHTNPFNDNVLSNERIEFLTPTQYDVGVDNNNYAPIPFRRLQSIISYQSDTSRRYRSWE